MRIDAHYFAIFTLARIVGFKIDIAYKIAYSSQFVDDNKVNSITIENLTNDIADEFRDGNKLENLATCHNYFKLHTFNLESMIANTTAFHFVPGLKGNNYYEKLCCAADSVVIEKILSEVIMQSNPFLLGITLHAFADTFSHQNFSGILSRENDINKLKCENKFSGGFLYKFLNTFKKFSPNFDTILDTGMVTYGHGQAFIYPDEPYLVWSYYKHNEKIEVNNPKRFKLAFVKIAEILIQFLDLNDKFRDNTKTLTQREDIFEPLLLSASLNKRIKNWKKFIIKSNLLDSDHEYLTYDKNSWMNNGFDVSQNSVFQKREIKKIRVNEYFEHSEIFSFYQAVHNYKRIFFSVLKDEGISLPTVFEYCN